MDSGDYTRVFLIAVAVLIVVSIPLGVIAAIILHFVNKRPVKVKKDEGIRLNLNGPEQGGR